MREKQENPDEIKREFAKRLNDVLDEMGIPPKGKGRQKKVAAMFGVDQKAARKWLEAEGFPEFERCIQIALKLNVAMEWLLTGRGEKHVVDDTNALLAELLGVWYRMQPDAQEEVLRYAHYLINKAKPAANNTHEIRPKKPH